MSETAHFPNNCFFLIPFHNNWIPAISLDTVAHNNYISQSLLQTGFFWGQCDMNRTTSTTSKTCLQREGVSLPLLSPFLLARRWTGWWWVILNHMGKIEAGWEFWHHGTHRLTLPCLCLDDWERGKKLLSCFTHCYFGSLLQQLNLYSQLP